MRKTKVVVIPGAPSQAAGERDNGKRFLVSEMFSRPAEKWATRCFLALAHSRADLPAGIGREYDRVRGSMAGIYRIASLVGHINFPELEPLMDELLTNCVRYVVDDRTDPPVTRAVHDVGDENDDIQEIATRHLLRAEAVDIHVGFSLPAAILNLIAVGSTLREISPSTSPNIQTYRRRSRSS